MDVRFIDLFAGVGGFHKGLEQASLGCLQQDLEKGQGNKGIEDKRGMFNSRKFDCVWACEWDKHAASIYKKNFPEVEVETGDIRQVPDSSVPRADLLCAGFPCQAFSLAGKRKGFEEARGTLFYEICRIAKAKRIPFILLENVKGLLSAQEGEAFRIVLDSLDELGYVLQWQVLNSKNFGVPQNRERVFVVGCLGKERFRQVFPLGENDKAHSGKEPPPSSYLKSPIRSQGDKPMIELMALNPRNFEGKSYVGGKQAIGLNQPSGNNQTLVKSEQRIRRLTPKECERLQGFPDNWTAGLSDTQRYKCMGNAVTVNVVEAVGRRLLEVGLFEKEKGK